MRGRRMAEHLDTQAQRDKIAQCLVDYAEKALTTGSDPLGSLKDVLIELRLYLGVKPF